MTFDLIAAIGKTEDSAEVNELFNSIAPVRVSEDPPFRRYIGSPDNGLNCLLENGRVLAIQIYAQPTRSFSVYDGSLPFGLKIGMSQIDVHKLLGNSVQSNSVSSKFMLSDRDAKVVITYDDAMIVKLISISWLGN